MKCYHCGGEIFFDDESKVVDLSPQQRVNDFIKGMLCLIGIIGVGLIIYGIYGLSLPAPEPLRLQVPPGIEAKFDARTKTAFGRKVSYTMERCWVATVYGHQMFIERER